MCCNGTTWVQLVTFYTSSVSGHSVSPWPCLPSSLPPVPLQVTTVTCFVPPSRSLCACSVQKCCLPFSPVGPQVVCYVLRWLRLASSSLGTACKPSSGVGGCISPVHAALMGIRLPLASALHVQLQEAPLTCHGAHVAVSAFTSWKRGCWSEAGVHQRSVAPGEPHSSGVVADCPVETPKSSVQCLAGHLTHF